MLPGLRTQETLIANSAQVLPKWTREFAPSFSLWSYHETRNLRGGGCNLSLSWHNERGSTDQGHLEPQQSAKSKSVGDSGKEQRKSLRGKTQFYTFGRTHTHNTHMHTHSDNGLMKAMQMQDCMLVSHNCRTYRDRNDLHMKPHTDW